MPGTPLDRDSIASLIYGSPPLLADYLSLEAQLQPNGFDLSLKAVAGLTTPGAVGAEDADRELSETEPMDFGPGGWLQLAPGPYLVTFNEVVNLPLNVMALGRPRSSLLRSGVAIHTAVWDAGYRGRSQALLVVYQPGGYRVQRDARLMQLVFFSMETAVGEGYQGRFQSENL
ncbi:MAG: deoxyuridine 5'-triphosphate nucleotidohydrolase [Chloroflexi bacterium]|nr:deoxyuridine 5'-triphosphate nucleotidohydrolase [Chloroflexota bacterium]MDA1269762.1 deoxyuridine 5'-triphosphate nucleotidohydrolase [Chloroflexota bacterium]PKB59092.1 MAG: deoxyuridine 5'-triphosphate nucleotidohydrolase [SAR202 cluster bacterium Casp-Chloro-G2]